MHNKETGHQKMFVYADGIHYGVDCMECPFRVRYEFRQCEDPKIHKRCDNIKSPEKMHWHPYKVKNWYDINVKGEKMTKEDFKEKIINKIKELKFPGEKFNTLIERLEADKLHNPHQTNPKKPNLDKIKSTTETAFQRAIFNGESAILQFKDRKAEVHWLDLELPVTFSGTARRKCIDLIGKINEKPFICELKFKGKSTGDSPEYGLFELLIYYYHILCNNSGKVLDEQKVFHCLLKDEFKWANIIDEKPMLILAANKSYWSHWLSKNRGGHKKDLFGLIETLNKELNVCLSLFQTEDIDFAGQKGTEKFYKPIMNIKTWEQVSMQK